MKIDRVLKIVFPIVIICAILPWVVGWQRNVLSPTIIKVIDLGEHPYVGFPGYGDGMAFAGPEANWTYVMRVWSDGTCEISRVTFLEDDMWSMTAWTHPSLEE